MFDGIEALMGILDDLNSNGSVDDLEPLLFSKDTVMLDLVKACEELLH